MLLLPVEADAANTVRITGLADVAYGTIANFTSDIVVADDVCVYSSTGKYSVTATGSGTSGAFTLASGANRLAYSVQWANSIGKTTGTALTAGTALSNVTTAASSQTCTSGLSASLITILTTSAVGAARAGTYTGTLTLLIAPN